MDEEERVAPHNRRRMQKRTVKRRVLFGKARQERFLEHLAATCHVTNSAKKAGVARETVYAARMRLPEFREGWRLALEQGYARLEAAMLERSIAGIDRPKVRGDGDAGPPIDPTIGLQLLREHKRGVFGTAPQPGKPADPEGARARLEKKLKLLGVRIGVGVERFASSDA